MGGGGGDCLFPGGDENWIAFGLVKFAVGGARKIPQEGVYYANFGIVVLVEVCVVAVDCRHS